MAKIDTYFNPAIELEVTKKYEMALVNLETYYTFPNINKTNNIFRYSDDDGANWIDIHIPTGCYNITDLDTVIKQQMKHNGHYDETNNIYPVHIFANENRLNSVMTIQDRYQIDFTSKNSLCNVLGFHHKIYLSGQHFSEDPVNILSVNSIFVTLYIISNSYLNGIKSKVIYSFFPSVPPGYKILENPRNLVYLPISLHTIQSMTCELTDQDGKTLDLRGEILTIRFHIREI